MKTFIALTSLLLTLNLAFASEREFRIDHFKPIVDGYSIGWGVPGKLIDFEKLDASSDEEINTFINTANVVNYLVDVQNNKILKTITAEDVDYSIGSFHIGNHFYLNVDHIKVDGLCNECEIIAVRQSQKWWSGIDSLDIINREKSPTIIKSFSEFQIDNLVKNEMKKKVKGKVELDLIESGAANIEEISEGYLEDIGYVNKITYNFSIPKSEDKSLTVEGIIKFTLVKDELKVKVISIKQSLE